MARIDPRCQGDEDAVSGFQGAEAQRETAGRVGQNRGNEECMRCDWIENRQFILSELERIARITERMDDRLRDLGEALEAREMRLRQHADERDRQHVETLTKLREIVEQNRNDIGKLGSKVGVLGGIAGFVSLIGMAIWELFRRGLEK